WVVRRVWARVWWCRWGGQVEHACRNEACGQLARDAAQQTMSAAVLLLALDALPLREKLATGRDLRSREHMGVASDELFVQAARDVVRVERPLLPRELRVQRDLQKKVAQLVAETRRIARVESGERLVGLLQKVRAQRDVRLLAVPGAPVGCAKPFDDAQHRID